MKISRRLYLAVLPAILGLFTVAALAYWGHLYRAAPEWVVVGAAVASVASLFIAQQNTRYVARRIERLAGRGEFPDELDSIEDVVDRLSSAVTVAEAGIREREAVAVERVQEYAAMLAEASAAMSRQLDEIRMPLHILLENHFGQLNENQEEMLEAARSAAESVEQELHRLQEIAQLDRGALNIRREHVHVGELLRGLRPQLVADGERTSVGVEMDVTPGLPRVLGDRIRLQEALELLLRHLVRHAAAGSAVSVSAGLEAGFIVLTILNGPAPTLDPDLALARRIILAHGASIDMQEGRTVVKLAAVSRP